LPQSLPPPVPQAALAWIPAPPEWPLARHNFPPYTVDLDTDDDALPTCEESPLIYKKGDVVLMLPIAVAEDVPEEPRRPPKQRVDQR